MTRPEASAVSSSGRNRPHKAAAVRNRVNRLATNKNASGVIAQEERTGLDKAVEYNNGWDRKAEKLEQNASNRFVEADRRYHAATRKNIKIHKDNGYRSVERQAHLYERKKWFGEGNPTDRPGHSTHNYGLAVDLENYNDPKLVEAMTELGWTRPKSNEKWHFVCESSPSYPAASQMIASLKTADATTTRWWRSMDDKIRLGKELAMRDEEYKVALADFEERVAQHLNADALYEQGVTAYNEWYDALVKDDEAYGTDLTAFNEAVAQMNAWSADIDNMPDGPERDDEIAAWDEENAKLDVWAQDLDSWQAQLDADFSFADARGLELDQEKAALDSTDVELDQRGASIDQEFTALEALEKAIAQHEKDAEQWLNKVKQQVASTRGSHNEAALSFPIKSTFPSNRTHRLARHKCDAGVSAQSFINKALTFETTNPAGNNQVDQPSLVSSIHGAMADLFFTVPDWIAFPVYAGDLRQQIAILDLWAQLPGHTRIKVFSRQDAIAALEILLTNHPARQRVEFAQAPDWLEFSVWAEDAYAVIDDRADQETFFLEPASFRRGDDSQVADHAAAQIALKHAQVPLYFQGGNLLIGDNFWLIGMDYPNHSLQLGFVTPQPDESKLDAVKRVYGELMDNQRELIAIGSRVAVPGFESQSLIREFDNNGERWKEELYVGNDAHTVQPIFHIDMFITLVGRNDQGKYQVLVGDPAMAAELLKAPLPKHAMASAFDDYAKQLDDLGFDVIRNPLPLTYDDDVVARYRTWYFASANNALVEVKGDNKHVWLPTYGHDNWPELTVTDQKNVQIWTDLGFEVHQLENFHPFAIDSGAVHCISKYLKRAM